MSDNSNRLDYSIYEMKGYPVKHKKKDPFRPDLKLDRTYHEMVEKIRHLDMRLDEMILSDKDYLDLVTDAYSTNIHWSVKIEGNNLSLEEVRRITKLYTEGKSENESKNGPKQEILNHLYSFFAGDIFQQPWTLNTMITVHSILMKDVNSKVVPGEFRDVPASIVGDDGFEYFITCPTNHIESELKSLLDWLEFSPFDPVCTSILFFHEFESIHPFSDGNGRTGRTLLQILLQERGLKNSKLCKFELELLKDTETYYTLLAYTDETGDYVPFIFYVTEALLRSYEGAVQLFESKDRLKELDEMTKTIAKRSKTVREFTVADANSWVSTVQDQTVRTKLKQLVSLGILEKEGNTRSTKYHFKDPFKDLK
jgi:Fic family protein